MLKPGASCVKAPESDHFIAIKQNATGCTDFADKFMGTNYGSLYNLWLAFCSQGSLLYFYINAFNDSQSIF